MKSHTFFVLAVIAVFGFVFVVPQEASAFAWAGQTATSESTGFFSGIWHGLLAPYSLVARWFITDVVMYAIPNNGWFYDLGFLIGSGGSIPLGWLAAIIATASYLFF